MDNRIDKGYLEEIKYQKHMLENLHRWFTLSFLITAICVTLIYFFYSHLLTLILCVLLTIISSLSCIIFGYGIFKGQKNINKVIDEYASIRKL